MTAFKTETTNQQLTREFDTVVSDAGHLLQSVANAGGEQAVELRASLEQTIAAAREELHHLQLRASETTRAAARATDAYVHHHPWQAIAIAAGVGAALGTVIALSLHRR